MTKTVCTLAALPLLAFAAAAASQQPAASTPAQPAQQAAEKPRLNLRLDDRDLRSAVPYAPNPKDASRKQDDGLPGLGGAPKRELDSLPPEVVVPKSNDRL